MTTQPYPDSTLTRWIDQVVAAFVSHWLALILIVLLTFVTVPFFAPLAMAVGWTDLGEWIYRLYSLFCHQLPQRSWFLFGDKLTYSLSEIRQVVPELSGWQLRSFHGTPEMGWKVAWSDRMISWYSMVPVLGLVYARLRHLGKPPRPISLRLFLWLLLPLVLDGGTHVLNDLFTWGEGNGFRDTNLWLAFLTGNTWPAFYAGDHLGTFNWWMRLLTGVVAAWAVVFWLFPWLNHWMTLDAARTETRSANSED